VPAATSQLLFKVITASADRRTVETNELTACNQWCGSRPNESESGGDTSGAKRWKCFLVVPLHFLALQVDYS